MPKKNGRYRSESRALREKPFPRRCPECGKAEVRPATIAYDAEIKHDGRLHAFHIAELRVNRCAACGEVLFGNETDEQINVALRTHLGLLSPAGMRDALRSLGLKQKQFAERIGVAAETVSRWMAGTHIQSRAMDNLMRLFFTLDAVRSALPPKQMPKDTGDAGSALLTS